jgi:PAS domain S-box-containing protein
MNDLPNQASDQPHAAEQSTSSNTPDQPVSDPEMSDRSDTDPQSSNLQAIEGVLREREQQFTAIAANLPGILYRVVLNLDGTIEFPYVRPAAEAIVGRNPGEHWLNRIHPDDRNEFFEVLRSSTNPLLPFDLEQRVISIPGQEIWVRNIARPHRRSDGAVIWDGMVLDITTQKQVELDLQRSLREKEALLQEIHHRVKNNLQIISSLLDLQTLSIPDPKAQQAFLDSQRRIRAMALVHEQLYHVETMSRIDFGGYVRTLIEYLQQSFLSTAARVAVQISIHEIWIDANAAIPCGLIINELVANAYKHAFPEGRDGTIMITCELHQANQLIVSVQDNGIGVPPPHERKPDTLGLKLVRTLARQLRGVISIDNQNGTIVKLTFTPGQVRYDV